jgi:hypothetical protein
MKKGIILALASLGLIACGGEDEKSTPNINAEFSLGIKGTEQEPALTNANVSEGDSISLNSISSGYVANGNTIRLSYSASQSGLAVLFLSSLAEDLDISISGANINTLESASSDSNEVIIFQAEAGVTYNIEVSSYEGSGNYQLKLVEPNRSSFGLNQNEYLVSTTENQVETCTTNSGSETYNYSSVYHEIINWNDGYVSSLTSPRRYDFSSVNGDSFTVNFANSSTDYSYSSSYTYTANFSTGAITGTAWGQTTYSNPTETCVFNASFSGSITL